MTSKYFFKNIFLRILYVRIIDYASGIIGVTKRIIGRKYEHKRIE